MKKFTTQDVTHFGDPYATYRCTDIKCCAWYKASEADEEITSLTNRNKELWERALNAERDLERARGACNLNPFRKPNLLQPMWCFELGGGKAVDVPYDPATRSVQVSVELMQEIIAQSRTDKQIVALRDNNTVLANAMYDIRKALDLWPGASHSTTLATAKGVRTNNERYEKENEDLRTILRQGNNWTQKLQRKCDAAEKALEDIKAITWRRRTSDEDFVTWRDYAANRFKETLKIIDEYFIRPQPTTGAEEQFTITGTVTGRSR